MMISVKDKMEIFYLSAEIFSYPDKDWFSNLRKLNGMVEDKITIPKQSLVEVESIYLNYFEHNSKKHGVVPIASFWIDGKTMSTSTINIKRFYTLCGFKDDSFGPPDHIGKMLSFCAVLLEYDKFDEFEKFKKWLYWLESYEKAVKKSIPLHCFGEVLHICNLLIKEKEV